MILTNSTDLPRIRSPSLRRCHQEGGDTGKGLTRLVGVLSLHCCNT